MGQLCNVSPLLVAVVWSLTAVAVAAEKEAARILEVRGEVSVENLAQHVRPAAIYGTVTPGERLRLQPESVVTLGWLNDGRITRLRGAGDATVGDGALETKLPIEDVAIGSGQKSRIVPGLSKLPRISPGAATIARSGKSRPIAPQVEPIVDSLVAAESLRFSWPVSEDADRYRLLVTERADRVWSAETREPTLNYSGKTRLMAKSSYAWSVEALAGSQPRKIAEGKFTIASEDQLAELRDLMELAQHDDPSIVAFAAIRMESLKFFEPALAAYQRLKELSPDSAPVYGAIADLEFRAGRMEAAESARADAERLGFVFSQK